MADILDKFIAQAKANVAAGYYEQAMPPPDLSKRASLRSRFANGFGLICEIKHASPAGEYSYAEADPKPVAETFARGGADAISVVAEPAIFKGKLANVAVAKETGLPVLFKDFVLDKRQVAAAARSGADCILLVMRVMDRTGQDANDYVREAHLLGLEVLLECYDEKELRRALDTEADLLGINNRDLQTLAVDLSRTERIIAACGRPINRPLISESGVRTADDLHYLRGCGVQGVLVGTALWKAGDMAAKVAELQASGHNPTPDSRANPLSKRFGEFGGQYAPEVLMPALEQLEQEFTAALADPSFGQELSRLSKDYAGRPTPLYFARRLSEKYGLRAYLKREDLLHTGAHKINNCLGQALLARRMGKRRLIAETGAGQHGVATATAAALLGMECEIYMGREDAIRQAPNVQRMELLGAKVKVVENGSRTLKDAINEALRDWASSFEHTHYLLGSALGPHPFPSIVRHFQSVIGKEAREQIMQKEGRLPDYLVACVGGGSNSIGLFSAFIADTSVKMIGVEAGGQGLSSGRHASRIASPSPIGVLHGTKSYVMQDSDGQVLPTHSISAGLDYPSIGPEHAYLHQSGRARYVAVQDDEALEAFGLLCRQEGIIPALESSHALAFLPKLAQESPGALVIVNLSGRGDKDLAHVSSLLTKEQVKP